MIETRNGNAVSSEMFQNYIRALVSRFFKILPIKESGEETLGVYMDSLQAELLGFEALIKCIHEDGDYMVLVNILQFLIDNQDCSVSVVRREVFKAISICNKLKAKYVSEMEG